MDLYPIVNVTVEQKTRAVWALCKRFGYGLNEDGTEDAEAWANDAARVQFYNQQILKIIRRIYAVEKDREAKAALAPVDSYESDLG